MKSDVRLRVLNQIQQMMLRVEELPPGGDLEGVIEDGLDELDQLVYRELLGHRQQTAESRSAAFSPSGVPALSKRDAPFADQRTPRAHAARGAEFFASGV
jgi:hypothetical protein